jgi:hypothetical protein
MSALALDGDIMSETSDTSKLAKLEKHDTLEDTKLGAATGGLGFAPFAPIAFAVCVATMQNYIIHGADNDGYQGPTQCIR